VLADNQSGEIIARAHNEVEKRPDAAAHAELLTIQRACEHQKNWRLSDTVLCVTLEPCTMCLGAIKLARIPTVVFGASDPRLGACGSIYDLSSNPALGSETRIIRGVQENLCKDLLNQFFAKVRKE
jgi:tRNA(adenine34) deaminase